VRAEVAWAALDCPSGIAAAGRPGLGGEAGWDTAILLGRMTATTLARAARSATRAGSSPGRTSATAASSPPARR
jgi:hypothetical protein